MLWLSPSFLRQTSVKKTKPQKNLFLVNEQVIVMITRIDDPPDCRFEAVSEGEWKEMRLH